MSRLKEPILDVLNVLKSIDVRNADGYNTKLFTRLWNNQIQYQEDGSSYSFPRPAAFVEVVNDISFEVIGLGYRSADIGFRIHVIHDYYNGDEMEQDLAIFDLRDKIISPETGLSQFCPTACGTMNCVREEMEYDHKNTYHYIMDFVCNFTDSTGSKFENIKEEVTENLDAQFYVIPKN